MSMLLCTIVYTCHASVQSIGTTMRRLLLVLLLLVSVLYIYSCYQGIRFGNAFDVTGCRRLVCAEMFIVFSFV